MFLCSLWFMFGVRATAQEPDAEKAQEPSAEKAQEPAAEKVQEIETGTVNITASTPSQVYVDHQVVGNTPLKINLPGGKHLVRIVADGFDPFVRRIKITPGVEQNLKGALNPGGGTVEFASPIPKATVQIDGQEAQVLPIRLKNLSPGEHVWTMNAQGHEEKSGSVVFHAGQNLYMYTSLDSSSGLAVFETTPEGAEIFMNNAMTPIGVTPFSTEGVLLDSHSVLLRSKGYSAAFRTMDNRDGSKGVIKTKLSKFGADVTISTNNKNSIITIEGIEVGKGRKASLGKIERGIYDLFVTTPGGLSANTRIHVPSKGAIHLRATLNEAESGKKSVISIVPPIWNQWYFWAGIGGAVAMTGVSSALIYEYNQPIPAPKGDVSVSLP
jgi:hypothetical protein